MSTFEGELVIWAGRRQIKSLFWYWVVGIPLILVDGLGLIILIVAVLKLVGSSYAITNEHAVARMGSLLHRGLHEVTFERIKEIQVRKGYIGRYLNYGDVVIETIDGDIFGMWGVDSPESVGEILLQAIEQSGAMLV